MGVVTIRASAAAPAAIPRAAYVRKERLLSLRFIGDLPVGYISDGSGMRTVRRHIKTLERNYLVHKLHVSDSLVG